MAGEEEAQEQQVEEDGQDYEDDGDEEEGQIVPPRPSSRSLLRARVEKLLSPLSIVPTRVEPLFQEDGLTIDIYLQFSRRLAEAEKVFSLFYGNALQYQVSSSPQVANSIRPLIVEVDLSVFYSETQVRKRRAAWARVLETRHALEDRRKQLANERKDLLLAVETLQKDVAPLEEDCDKDLFEHLQRDVGKLTLSLSEAATKDGAEGSSKKEQQPGTGRLTAGATAALVDVIAKLQETVRRGLSSLRTRLAVIKEEKGEKQRFDVVREVRVRSAKSLKELNERWRQALEKIGSMRRTAISQVFIDKTEELLAQARGLVLREAQKIINLEEYGQLLQSSLEQAKEMVTRTLRLLALQLEFQGAERGLAELQDSVKMAEEAMRKSAKRRGNGGGSTVSHLLLPRFFKLPSMRRGLREAKKTCRRFQEMQGSKDNTSTDEARLQKVAAAVQMLKDVYENALSPAWTLYGGQLLPLQTSLQNLRHRKQRLLEKLPGQTLPPVASALEEKFVAAKSAMKTVSEKLLDGKEEGKGNEKTTHTQKLQQLPIAALEVASLQQNIEEVNKILEKEEEKVRIQGEALRRLHDERALEERLRKEAMMAKDREGAFAQRRLEDLERRRAFLEATLGIAHARNRFKEAQQAMMGRKVEKEKQSDDSIQSDTVLLSSTTGHAGSKAILILPSPVAKNERWDMANADTAPPLKLQWTCPSNQVSAEFWIERKRKRQEVEEQRRQKEGEERDDEADFIEQPLPFLRGEAHRLRPEKNASRHST